MSNIKNREEPVILALQAVSRNNYNAALQYLNEMDNYTRNQNKRICHNKAVVEFIAGDLKNSDKFKRSMEQLLGVEFPDVEVKDYKFPCAAYNYAVILYHSRYYYQCVTILEALLEAKTIKNTKLLKHVVLLLMEATICRRTYEKTLNIARAHEDTFRDKEYYEIYERLVSRAQLLVNYKLKRKIKLNLKLDSIENHFILAQQHYLNWEINESKYILNKCQEMNHDYNLTTQGENVFVAINNNFGVINLSLKKPYLSARFFQHALKEYCKARESNLSDSLIVCKDRSLYVHNLGLALLVANNTVGAFECLVEAARHYPNSPRIWLHLAECCIKKNYSEELNQFSVSKLGSGPHSRVLISVNKPKYSVCGESFAIPSLSLEFAALCLKNVLILLHWPEEPSDTMAPIIQAPPGPPINWKQRCHLRNSALVLQSYVHLQLQDPLGALTSGNDLLSSSDLASTHKTWAHTYIVEALIHLDRINEALDRTSHVVIKDLLSVLPPHMHDMFTVSIISKAVVCYILKGDLSNARSLFEKITNSRNIFPLHVYLEVYSGNIDNLKSLIKKSRCTNQHQTVTPC